MELKVGCCGFGKGRKTYFKKFEIVEVQQTFYRPPEVVNAQKWREEAPYDFEFTVKAWQLITHSPRSPTYRRAGIKIQKNKINRLGYFRPTKEVFEAWEKTHEIAMILNSKLIIFQCPASFRPEKENISNMKAFFSTIERGDLKFAWEPRGSWPEDVISKICRELQLIHCVDPFKDKPLTKDIAYFRLHGFPPGKTMYNYNYTKEDLGTLKRKCQSFAEIYCMFNNIFMYENALDFIKIMGSA